MRYLVLLFSMLTVSVVASACNTVEGIGEDVKAAGQAIDEAAERNR